MANNVISTDALIAKFRQALSEGWGYIWGTAGEKWTAVKQKELEKTTDADRAQGRQYGSKWIGKTVADCSGLFSWAFRQLGGYMYHGSDTMYRKYCTDKGELKAGKRTDRGILKPGTAVFVWNGKKYSHLCFEPWQQIGEEMGYTARWAQMKHKMMLTVVEGILERRDYSYEGTG